MGESTKIQWAHATFNPWLGCSKVSTGCARCYAEHALPVAMRAGGRLQWGEVWQGGQRVVKADSGWKEPLKWAREAGRAGERRRVFCASLADVLEVPAMPPLERLSTDSRDRVNETRKMLDAARARLWDTIRQTACMAPHVNGHIPGPLVRPFDLQHRAGLDWLLLTKRPENWALVPKDVRPLVWLGTSISDQKTADEWVPRLLAAEGFRLRFLSLEPMVGPVDLWESWLKVPADRHSREQHVGSKVDLVIVGGESGSKARPLNVEWVRAIVEQCAAAGVKVFCKQLGSVWAQENGGDPKGGDMSRWPEDIRVRELPGE